MYRLRLYIFRYEPGTGMGTGWAGLGTAGMGMGTVGMGRAGDGLGTAKTGSRKRGTGTTMEGTETTTTTTMRVQGHSLCAAQKQVSKEKVGSRIPRTCRMFLAHTFLRACATHVTSARSRAMHTGSTKVRKGTPTFGMNLTKR